MCKTVRNLVGLAFCTVLCWAGSEKAVVITCPAQLERRDDWIYLTLTNSQHRYEIPWSMAPHYQGDVALKAGRTYTFTVVEEPSSWAGETQSEIATPRPEVTKVEWKGKVIYDREVCSAHKARMERKEVPIVYGYVIREPGAPSGKTAERLFPNRREVSMGGCVFTPGFSPEVDLVYVCSECKNAYEKWEAENLKDLMLLEQRDFGVIRSISLKSDGTYVEIRYQLYICSNLGGLEDGIAFAMGRYRFEDRRSRLLLFPDSESDEFSELYRARYWGKEYWVPEHDRARASRFRESSLRRSPLRVVR